MPFFNCFFLNSCEFPEREYAHQRIPGLQTAAIAKNSNISRGGTENAMIRKQGGRLSEQPLTGGGDGPERGLLITAKINI